MRYFHAPLAVTILALSIAACQAESKTRETSPAAGETNADTLTPEPSSTMPAEVSQMPATPTDEPAAEPEKALGIVSLEQDKVEHGSDVGKLKQVISSADFFAQDAIRVTEGGEALLDFGDQILMRMFNDTELQVVSADFAENTPPVVVMYLNWGGFTGQDVPQGAQAIFETPGGATITVLGTEYFVAYDPDTEVTSAGNFSGHVEATSAGSTVMIEEGYYVEIPADQPPGPQLPLPLSLADFEARARTLQSPLAAVEEAGEWLLEMSWKWCPEGSAPECENPLDSIKWSGIFTVNGESIAGEGIGTIPGHKDTGYVDWGGEFQFDISGKLVRTGKNKSAFQIEIDSHDLDLDIDVSECDPTARYRRPDESVGYMCSDTEKFILAVNQSVAEELSKLTSPIIIEAEDGTATLVEIDDTIIIPKLPFLYNSWRNFEPLNVAVRSVATQSN